MVLRQFMFLLLFFAISLGAFAQVKKQWLVGKRYLIEFPVDQYPEGATLYSRLKFDIGSSFHMDIVGMIHYNKHHYIWAGWPCWVTDNSYCWHSKVSPERGNRLYRSEIPYNFFSSKISRDFILKTSDLAWDPNYPIHRIYAEQTFDAKSPKEATTNIPYNPTSEVPTLRISTKLKGNFVAWATTWVNHNGPDDWKRDATLEKSLEVDFRNVDTITISFWSGLATEVLFKDLYVTILAKKKEEL